MSTSTPRSSACAFTSEKYDNFFINFFFWLASALFQMTAISDDGGGGVGQFSTKETSFVLLARVHPLSAKRTAGSLEVLG